MLFNNDMPDLFFYNQGDNNFSEEAAARGIDDLDGGSHGATFADLDNDGDYDLFNGTTYSGSGATAMNNLFRNNGAGIFTEVTAVSGIPDRDWPTRGVIAFDMDGDGDLDLFCVTNYQGSADPSGEKNEVYRNEGNLQFTPINSGILYTAPVGQGATDTDYDGDGDIDVWAGNRTGPVNILQNDGSGNFTLIDPTSIGITEEARDGITMGDIDNDGDLDMVFGSDPKGFLYRNNGDGTFTLLRSFSGTEGYMGALQIWITMAILIWYLPETICVTSTMGRVILVTAPHCPPPESKILARWGLRISTMMAIWILLLAASGRATGWCATTSATAATG